MFRVCLCSSDHKLHSFREDVRQPDMNDRIYGTPCPLPTFRGQLTKIFRFKRGWVHQNGLVEHWLLLQLAHDCFNLRTTPDTATCHTVALYRPR